MKSTPSQFSREDVLDAFAVEQNTGPETLKRYVRDYPEYAADLKELSQALSQPMAEQTGPLSEADNALIDKAWKRYQAAVPAAREVYPKGGADTTAVFVWKQNAAEQLDALGAQKECCCMWQENDGGCYGTGCNNAFELTWGTPKANNFKFCPFCGKTINTE